MASVEAASQSSVAAVNEVPLNVVDEEHSKEWDKAVHRANNKVNTMTTEAAEAVEDGASAGGTTTSRSATAMLQSTFVRIGS